MKRRFFDKLIKLKQKVFGVKKAVDDPEPKQAPEKPVAKYHYLKWKWGREISPLEAYAFGMHGMDEIYKSKGRLTIQLPDLSSFHCKVCDQHKHVRDSVNFIIKQDYPMNKLVGICNDCFCHLTD